MYLQIHVAPFPDDSPVGNVFGASVAMNSGSSSSPVLSIHFGMYLVFQIKRLLFAFSEQAPSLSWEHKKRSPGAWLRKRAIDRDQVTNPTYP
jgi:hypothetical protein